MMGKRRNGGTGAGSNCGKSQSGARRNGCGGDSENEQTTWKSRLHTAYKGSRDYGVAFGRAASTPLGGELKSGVHDLPWRSLMIFVVTATVATSAALLIVMAGVVLSQSVWSILVTTGFIAVLLVAVCLVSLVNFIRGVITVASSSIRSRFVFALWKYFGTVIQVGCIILLYNFFKVFAWGLFYIPMVYFIPMEILGTTCPIPVFLPNAFFSGSYIGMAAYVIAMAVTVAGFVTGGLDLLAAIADRAHEGSDAGSSSLYDSFLYVLFVTVFPALNIIVAVHLINSYTSILLNQIPVS